ncbi:MAG: hypothetical protein K2L19_06740 [Eubacterium sp.]|nr:hypothetical protein [Eubacterium sp.]
MKLSKTILAVLTALIMIIAPQAYCFAAPADAGQSQTAAYVGLISDSFWLSDDDIRNGDIFELSFNLKNTSKTTDIKNINLRLSGGEAFSIANDIDTVYIESLAKGGNTEISKSFYCSTAAETGMYPITVSASYEYTINGEIQQASTEFSITVKVTKSGSNSMMLTPQVLVTGFSYGGKEINGGEIFTLSFTVKNNSSTTDIKNIIIKLSGGESFVVADGTDTVSMDTLGAGKSTTLSKSFKCLSGVQSGVYPVTAAVSYEYIDDSAKQAGSADLTMSVPVVQPDKVQFQSIDLMDKTVTINEETDCAFSLVNSGQTRLSNGTVKLFDAAGKELASAYIGNIEPGSQFTSNYTLPVTLTELGAKKLTLVLEYDNENLEKKSIEQEFSVTVEEMFDPFENLYTDDETNSTESRSNVPVIIGICVGAVVLIVIIIVTAKVVKKKKAKKGSDFNEEI